MLVIEKYKEEIENYDDSNTTTLECYLARVTTKLGDEDNCSREDKNCSECLKLSLLDLAKEYKEPVKLTRLEYEYLKIAKKEGFKFIARDANNALYIYDNDCTRYDTYWNTLGNHIRIFDTMFSFVKWEDEEPWNIDEILANCEVIENEES